MPSAPNETAAEDVRNALQLLQDCLTNESRWHPDTAADVLAARVRLESALTKFQDAGGLAIGKREQELGMMLDAKLVEDRAMLGVPLDYDAGQENDE